MQVEYYLFMLLMTQSCATGNISDNNCDGKPL